LHSKIHLKHKIAEKVRFFPSLYTKGEKRGTPSSPPSLGA
jgi:hypothetical protein